MSRPRALTRTPAHPGSSMSTPHGTASVRLEPAGGYKFTASFPSLSDVAPIHLDEGPPLGEASAPSPGALLAAAIGGCLAASFTFCLHKSRVQGGQVSADVEARIVRNDEGRLRVGGVSVVLTVAAPDGEDGKVERCASLYEDFCIVTESVRHGVPVDVRIETRQARSTSAG